MTYVTHLLADIGKSQDERLMFQPPGDLQRLIFDNGNDIRTPTMDPHPVSQNVVY